MNPLVKILCYIAAVLLVASLLSPPVYWACEWMVREGWLVALKGFPFHRYFDRIAQITALILAWPLVRSLHLRMVDLGLQKNPVWGKDVLAGFVAAILPLLAFAAVCLWLDVYHLKSTVAWGKLGAIAGAAIVVPLMEEFFFRGMLLGLALKVTGRWRAIFGVSLLFAIIHFLKPEKAAADPASVTWASGFGHLGSIFSTIAAQPGFVLGGCATLLLGGIILGYCVVKTQSLWLGIGIHAAWIFGQQSFNLIARFRVKPPDALLPWIGPSQVSGAVPIGVGAIVALFVTAVMVYWYLHARSVRPNASVS